MRSIHNESEEVQLGEYGIPYNEETSIYCLVNFQWYDTGKKVTFVLKTYVDLNLLLLWFDSNDIFSPILFVQFNQSVGMDFEIEISNSQTTFPFDCSELNANPAGQCRTQSQVVGDTFTYIYPTYPTLIISKKTELQICREKIYVVAMKCLSKCRNENLKEYGNVCLDECPEGTGNVYNYCVDGFEYIGEDDKTIKIEGDLEQLKKVIVDNIGL